MTWLIPTVLFGWILLAPLLFVFLPKRKAMLASVIAGTLFLPMAGFRFEGLPEFSKGTVIGYGLLLGMALFAFSDVVATRFRMIDMWMLGWIAVTAISILVNDLPLKFAATSTLSSVLIYGAPYLAGRVFVRDAAGAADLASAIVLGGLIYVPLCWVEIRFSPQLHYWVYGYHQHFFGQTLRDGAWRPMVFMQHGLMVAAWMMSAILMAAWLLAAKVPKVWHFSTVFSLVTLLGTFAFIRSLGALILCGVGIGLLLTVRAIRVPVLIAVLAIAPVSYLVARIAFRWDVSSVVAIAESTNPERAQSFKFRIDNEVLLVARALEQPYFGWGGFNLNRVQDDSGNVSGVTDSLWVALLGVRGLVGIACLYAWLMLPPLLVLWRCQRRPVPTSHKYTLLGFCTISLLFVVDTMFNAMINQIFFMLCGALVSTAGDLKAQAARHPAGRGKGADPRPEFLAVNEPVFR